MPALNPSPHSVPQTAPQAAPQQMSDPLAQLRDIHLPDSVSAWPPAPGWWLLAALLLSLAVWGGYRLRQQYRRNAYRRQAQQELSMLESDNTLTRAQTIARLNALLKRIALHAYPKSNTASFSGTEWIKFLNSSCPSLKHNQDRICFEIFQTGPYQAEITEDMLDRSSLFADCRHWIQHHLNATELGKRSRTAANPTDITAEAT